MSKVVADTQIVRLPEGGTGLCRFNPDGSASLRVLGHWIEFEGTYLPGDAAAVLHDYKRMTAAVEEGMRLLEMEDEEFKVEMITPPEGMRIRTPEDRTLNLPREAVLAAGLVVEELDYDEEIGPLDLQGLPVIED